ncbi:peptidase C19, ubiquitin carboxyl-terminal hydrolase 2 [Coprinellus micaceus]|uniref:ubiquitinyl hydrolase 1 n=1 Tax=Coprinellus micaceus TaxID=71717 RepID=A0A4Y7TCC5_COPMI|nr:peptidase C19, ubiquitin carboxyl-terminal hydrolase 2 [Coprinellus micaceus]
MAKQKAPTPQELYQQRRQREEQERTAYLPPGLINHGNTCFMNSVLQGLIATQLLSDLVHFAPIPQAVQDRAPTLLAGQRSPHLTNGHNLAGPYDKPWVNTMPIGDVFLSVMYKAWNAQAKRERVSLSPRSLLGTLGKKYDQYLDFAQQDAHEFLRILLDAMRMEEFDIIKVRQPPPPPKPKVRRRTTVVPHIPSNSPNPLLNIDVARQRENISEEEKLVSFADLIFGGKLTSILVCQKCKNVSQTYEDFNDISLSIKPEDNLHRTRDKLKNFAKRLTAFPTGSGSNPSPFRLSPLDLHRPSSVPPSPKERPDGQLISRDETPPTSEVRRRSLDIPADEARSELSKDEDGDKPPISKDALPASDANQSEPATASEESESGHVLVNVSGPEGKHVDFVEVTEKHEKKEKKEDTNWAKLGRRLSLGLGRSKERKSRSSERTAHRVSAPIIEGVPMLSPEDPKAKRLSTDSSATPRASLSGIAQVVSGRTPSPDTRLLGPKQFLTESPRPSAEATRPISPSSLNPDAVPIRPTITRSKSPKPPKPTPGEAEYLRKILADVSTPGPGNPLSTLFKGQASHPAHGPGKNGSSPLSSHNVWLGMHQLSGIEECLRMFTAVEVLDGENMVGCRRCWKIANGQMPKSKGEEVENESSDSAGQSSPTNELHPTDDRTPLPLDFQHSKPPHVLHIQTSTGVHIPTSISTPTVSYYAENNQQEVYNSDARSISSLPPVPSPGVGLGTEAGSTTTLGSSNTQSSPTRTSSVSELSVEGVVSPGGLPIPTISTTAPDQPPSSEPSADPSAHTDGTPVVRPQTPTVIVRTVNGIVAPQPTRPSNLVSVANTESKDSLPVPPTVYRAGRRQGDATTDEESSADESDTSYGTSVSAESEGRSDPSPPAPPGLGIPGTPTAEPPSTSKPQKKKASKPKPVIMRPAYKRYLVDTPPPVLVVHLKRFQQLSKTPFLSFSHGFKKLDDYITFPEHLDLTPYLAPKKEDYGLDKKKGGSDAWKSGKKGKGKDERCTYRLYAVVVHIGNMLGGHYIAYVALPTKSPLEGEGLAIKKPAPAPATNATSSESSGVAAAEPTSATTPSTPSPASPPTSSTLRLPAPDPQPATDKPRQWAYISDTIVRLTTLEEVLSAKAYICMYERC